MALPNGAKVFIESERGAEIEFSAVSNSLTPTGTTATDSGLKKGQWVLVLESVWPGFKNKVLRVKEDATATEVVLEGDKSSSTLSENDYPPGGASTIVVIDDWLQIPCVSDIAKSGGEQQYQEKQCLEDDRAKQIPTYKSATTLSYTFDFDYANAVCSLLVDYDKSGLVRALRMYVPKASFPNRAFSGRPSFDDIPDTVMNQDETVTLNLSLEQKYAHLKDVV